MQDHLQLSKLDMQYLLDFMDHCLYINRAEQVHAVLNLLQKVIPFEHAAICTVDPRATRENSLTQVVAHTHEPRWVSAYLANGYHRVDPVIGYAFGQAKAFCWLAAFQAADADNLLFHEFLQSASDYGLQSGAALRVGSASGDSQDTLLSVSFFRDVTLDRYPALPEQYLRVMELVLPHIHRALDRVATADKSESNNEASPARMTPRELEVMQWASAGKTSWEIARILGISERTVKFHFSSVFAKLNVVNRSQAVAKAMRHGLIPTHLPASAARESMTAKA